MAVGVRFIYEPLSLVTGGVSGFAIVVGKLTEGVISGGVPVWVTTTVLNIPLFVAGWYLKGRMYIIKSLYATVLFSVLLYIIPNMNVGKADYLMAAVWGGVLTGAGLGLVILTGASAGGTDLLGAIIRSFMPECSISSLVMYIDSAVVISGAVVFGLSNALYAIIAVYVAAKVMDAVISGPNYAKMIMIITDKHIKLADDIFRDVNRGVTGIEVTGMYSKEIKYMLMCVASKRESIRILKITRDSDPFAFVMIADIKEILGEGFVKVDEYFK
ncbi:MAG: YitT family protein [Lachnospiraceae bacterium]|nr:YitT family protein [Lachnospiraceae bacterium]